MQATYGWVTAGYKQFKYFLQKKSACSIQMHVVAIQKLELLICDTFFGGR